MHRVIRRFGPTPWWIWLLVVAVIVLFVQQLWQESSQHAIVIGSGSGLATLTPRDAPKGVRFRLQTEATEPLEATAQRIERELARYPDMIVFGLDASTLRTDDDSIDQAIRLAKRGT